MHTYICESLSISRKGGILLPKYNKIVEFWGVVEKD